MVPTTMIDRIHLLNFKNHADTHIAFGRITALIGPNSSGKTNVLQALDILSQIVSALLEARELSEAVFTQNKNVNTLVRYGQKVFRIELEGNAATMDGASETTPWGFVAKISIQEFGPISIGWRWGKNHGQPMPEIGKTDIKGRDLLQNLEREWGHIAYLKAIGKNLSEPSLLKNLSKLCHQFPLCLWMQALFDVVEKHEVRAIWAPQKG